MRKKKPSQPSTSASFYSPRGIEAAREGIADPVFGTLKDTPGGLFWRGRYDSPKFGKVVLSVRCKKTVSGAERDAFTLFRANEDQIFKDAETFLFDTYKRFLVNIENDPFQGPEDFDQLNTSDQIWEQLDKPFLGGTSLHVLYSRERTVYLSLGWNCSWDIEHGIHVCIENGKVVSRERWLELE